MRQISRTLKLVQSPVSGVGNTNPLFQAHPFSVLSLNSNGPYLMIQWQGSFQFCYSLDSDSLIPIFGSGDKIYRCWMKVKETYNSTQEFQILVSCQMVDLVIQCCKLCNFKNVMI